jgi:hexosaminidase
MLDCSRTFQSIEYLKQTLDRMAVYKLNVLHLHLTDDQGWRIEIMRYPELTARGAFFPAKYNEPAAHQGFYTQKQMRDLVAYAAARHITIVPEIEMPGHSLAALSVLPHLSCTGGPFEIYPYKKEFGPLITPDIFCAGQEETFEFFSNVLAEVIDIFPSKYIHIGGDEAPKVRWKACPLCQKRIKDEGLKNEVELQSWFIRRAEKMVAAKGRRLIGWDEIAEGGLSPNATVMWWRAKSGQNETEIVKNALHNGHETVMSPNTYCYFDYTYQRTDTLRAYSFEPIPPELDAAQAGLVLGLQACFWSHIDREPERVDYQLFPRLLAIAERGWSPKDTRDPADFSRRITSHAATLEQLGVHYRPESTPTWGPAQVTQDFRPLEWNVTDLTRGPGSYEVTFTFRMGTHRLAIRSVELLADGKVVAAEQRAGVTGSVNSGTTYRLSIPPDVPGTAYTLRAEVRAEGGTDSNGEILIRRM